MARKLPRRAERARYFAEQLEPRRMLTVVITSGTDAAATLVAGQQLRLVSYNNRTLATLTPINCNAQFGITGSTLTSVTQKGRIDTLLGADFTINGIGLTNTDALSTFKIDVARNVNLPVNGITTDGAINTVRLGGTTFSGAFATMGARNLNFGDVTGATLNFGSGLGATTFRAGTITDSTFNFDSPVTLFQTGPVMSTFSGSIRLTAPYITDFKIKGDASLNLTLGTLRYSLGNADISGSVTGTWSTAGPINSLRAGSFASGWSANVGEKLNFLSSKGDFAGFLSTPVAGNIQLGSATSATMLFTQPFATNTWNVSNLNVGAFSNSTLRSDGNLGFLRFGSMVNSTVFAGVNPAVGNNSVPMSSQIISSTNIKGEYVRTDFQNSFTAANSFGKLDLGSVISQPNGNPFGVTASKIGSLEFDINNKRVSAFNVDRLLDVQNAELKRGVTSQDLGNFQINIAQIF